MVEFPSILSLRQIARPIMITRLDGNFFEQQILQLVEGGASSSRTPHSVQHAAMMSHSLQAFHTTQRME